MSVPSAAPPTAGLDGRDPHGSLDDRLSLAGLDLQIGRVSAIDATTAVESGDIVIDGRLGSSPWRVRLPSGLVLLTLGSAIDLPTLLRQQPEDAALVAEHLLGTALDVAERRLGRRVAIDRLTGGADAPVSPVASGQGLAYRVTLSVADSDFTIVVQALAMRRLGRLLGAAAARAPSATHAVANAMRAPRGGAPILALGPLYIETATLKAIESGDILELGAGETLTGGLFAETGVVPIAVAADTATIAAAFDRAALQETSAVQAKLWVECGTADAAAAPLPMAGTRIAWTAFSEDEAWLTLDGCRTRLARGRLVDTDGHVALRVEQAETSSWTEVRS